MRVIVTMRMVMAMIMCFCRRVRVAVFVQMLCPRVVLMRSIFSFALFLKVIVGVRGRLLTDLSAFKNVDLGAENSTTVDLFNLQRCSQVEGGNGGMQNLWIDARVEERSKKHVAADTGEAVKIGNSHRGYSFTAAEVIAVTGRTSFIDPER